MVFSPRLSQWLQKLGADKSGSIPQVATSREGNFISHPQYQSLICTVQDCILSLPHNHQSKLINRNNLRHREQGIRRWEQNQEPSNTQGIPKNMKGDTNQQTKELTLKQVVIRINKGGSWKQKLLLLSAYWVWYQALFSLFFFNLVLTLNIPRGLWEKWHLT